MASKYQKRGYWYIKYKTETGEWKPIACGKDCTASEAEYLRKVYESKELNLRHKAPVRMISAGLIDALNEFKDKVLTQSDIGRDLVPRSIRRQQVVIENFLKWAEKEDITEYREITRPTIAKYLQYLKDNKKSPRTRFEERRVLNKFFKWSIEKFYWTENPVEKIPAPKYDNSRPRFFTEAELKEIFANSKPPYNMLYKILYLTGMRIGELGNIEEYDYIKELKQIQIRIMPGNKTKREEPAHLNDSAVKTIDEFIEWKKQFKTADSKKYLFCNADGLKLDNDNIYRNLKRTLEHCNISNASPHTFRHTCASHLVIKGVSLYIVSKILRHKSIEETEIYAHLSKEAVADAIKILTA